MKNETLKISAYLITFNEENHLDEVLSSIKGVDEIVIVDSGSTDKTLEIALRHNAKIFHQEWLGFARQKAFAMKCCKNNWLLNLDGDEVLPSDAIAIIREAISSNPEQCLSIRRDDLFMGASMKWIKLKYFKKIYRKDKSKWRETDIVHEHIEIDAKPMQISPIFKHYGYDSVTTLTSKTNQYSSLKAKQRQKNKRPVSALRLAFIFPIMFIKFYFFHRFFIYGWRGFIKAMIEANYFFLTEAKLYEIKYRNDEV